MTRYLLIAFSLLLAACGGRHSPPPIVVGSGWVPFYSTGIARCDNFDFGELHYCITSMGANVGQTVRMTFTTSGSGSLYPTGAGDIPPATIALFIWRRGDDMTCAGPMQQYRYWYKDRPAIVVGSTQTLTGVLAPENWTDCYGRNGADNPAAFAAVLNDLAGIGFTTGGAYFAGHGVGASGQVHFTLNDYTVGATSAVRKGSKKRRR